MLGKAAKNVMMEILNKLHQTSLELAKNAPINFGLSIEEKNKFKKIFRHLNELYPNGSDAWGLRLDKAKTSLKWVYPLYKHYFRVRVFGKENVADETYMVISNHSGQIAIDGMLVSTAFITDINPARVLRPMVERFFTGLPFVGPWAAEGGAVLGDRQNCINLLKRKQSVLVFPEGVRGITKSPKDFYKLAPFTQGFYRMALTAKVKILPVCVIGAEEFYPFVYHPRLLAKWLGLPALPLSPNLVPLPSPVDIYIGEPVTLPEHLDYESPDREVCEEIYQIEETIKSMIKNGLEKRRTFWANFKGIR